MDSLLEPLYQTILNWQFFLFCLAISAIVFVLRKVVEYALIRWTSFAKESKLWRDVVLPVAPVFLGLLGALVAKNYPYPVGLSSSSGRLAFGLAAGLLSGFIFRMVTAFLSEKIVTTLSNIMAKLKTTNTTETDAATTNPNEVAGNKE